MEKKKVGRPQGKTFAKAIPVRWTEDQLKQIAAAMKGGNWVSISDFVRQATMEKVSKINDM